MSSFDDYPADDQSKQSMHEPGFPLHHRVDDDSSGGLCALSHVEVRDHQLRNVELLADYERGVGAQAAVPRSLQAKVVTLGHLDSQFFLVGIRARAFYKERFTPVLGDYRDALIERADVDLPFC